MPKLINTISGASASRFAFGTMQFGAGSSAEDCVELYEMSRQAGINVFDTAYGYTEGASEKIIGKLIEKERDNILLMSKCAHPAPSTEANIRAQFEESRKRLGQDVIDVLFLHRWDPQTDLEETLTPLAEFKANGQIRSIGVSNFSAWQVMKTRAVAEKLGLSIDVIQPMYNLVKRQAEVELLPMSLSEDIAVTTYSPLGGGLLTGKYAEGQTGRLKENPEYTARYNEQWAFDAANAIVAYASEIEQHPATLAIAWVAKNPGVTSVLISGKNAAQFQPSLDAISFQMSDDMYAQISDLSRTPPPATDRLEERTQ